jgi:hypothetical protein
MLLQPRAKDGQTFQPHGHEMVEILYAKRRI